jgi:hypothetical protein
VSRPRRASESADVAYLRPIVQRLGAAEVHRLVDLIAVEVAGDDDAGGEPGPAST